jgi:hypothetical protein
MAGFAAIIYGGKGRAAAPARSRADDAARRRACAWLERRRQQPSGATQATTAQRASTKAGDGR